MSQGSKPTDGQPTDRQPTHLEIMMFLDGELSGEEAKVVARHLEESEEGASIAASLGQVSELVRTSVELEADAAEDKLAGLWAGIDEGIVSSKASNGVHAQDAVISFQDAAEAKATEKLVQQSGWFGGWQSHVAIGVLAAAAAFVIMYKSQGAWDQASSQQAQTAQTTPANPPQIVPVVLRSQEPVVEELEVYDGSAVIMTVLGDAKSEPASAVIWISSDTDVTPESI